MSYLHNPVPLSDDDLDAWADAQAAQEDVFSASQEVQREEWRQLLEAARNSLRAASDLAAVYHYRHPERLVSGDAEFEMIQAEGHLRKAADHFTYVTGQKARS